MFLMNCVLTPRVALLSDVISHLCICFSLLLFQGTGETTFVLLMKLTLFLQSVYLNHALGDTCDIIVHFVRNVWDINILQSMLCCVLQKKENHPGINK